MLVATGTKALVKLAGQPDPPTSEQGWDVTVAVLQESSVRVAGVFPKVGRSGFSAEIFFEGNSGKALHVPFTERDPIPVIIPARFC